MPIGFDIRDRFQRSMLIDDYEPVTEEILRSVLRIGDTYIDIGAQLGYTAAQAADCVGRSGRMILFEPDPAALERLKAHLALADPSAMPETQLVEAACSSGPGEMLFEQAVTLGHSRILQQEEELRDGRLIRVPLVAADDYMASMATGAVRLLKIDAEGHEHSVLCGLQRSLAASVPQVIMIEKNLHLFDLPSEDAAGLHALIVKHGYVGFHETTRSPITRASIVDTSTKIENLYYASDPGLLRHHFSGSPSSPSEGFTQRELEDRSTPFLDMHHPLCLARKCILLVKRGHLAEGIAQGEELLVAFPELNLIRGHLAAWYSSNGDTDSALTHYRLLLEREPDNQAAARRIEEMSPQRT